MSGANPIAMDIYKFSSLWLVISAISSIYHSPPGLQGSMSRRAPAPGAFSRLDVTSRWRWLRHRQFSAPKEYSWDFHRENLDPKQTNLWLTYKKDQKGCSFFGECLLKKHNHHRGKHDAENLANTSDMNLWKVFFRAKVGVFTDESGVEIPWCPWFVHHKIGRQNANWKSTIGGFSNQNTILLMYLLQLHNQQTTVIHFSNKISNLWFSNVKAATIYLGYTTYLGHKTQLYSISIHFEVKCMSPRSLPFCSGRWVVQTQQREHPQHQQLRALGAVGLVLISMFDTSFPCF